MAGIFKGFNLCLRLIREGALKTTLFAWRVERWIEVNQIDGIRADVLSENLEVVPVVKAIHICPIPPSISGRYTWS